MSEKHRLTIQIDSAIYDLLTSLSEKTGLSISTLIRSALLFRLEDFYAFDEWIDTHEAGSKTRLEAIESLKSPGPRSILQDIKRLDPCYKTAGALMSDEIAPTAKATLEERVAALEAMVATLTAAQE